MIISKALAIIPARGGSKRIPKKNIKEFYGKPIIAYSIDAAIKSNLFDEIMVSTDDFEIKNISEKAGAKVPFLRSEKTSDDVSGLAEVIEEVIYQYNNLGKDFKYICCLLPTAPFITAKILTDGFDLLIENKFKSVFPIIRFSYPIQRALKIVDNKISMIWSENYSVRSQDLIKAYHDAGQFYWLVKESFLLDKKLFTDNSGAIILSDLEVQDIDTIEDWERAEIIYKIILDNKDKK